MGYGYQYLKIIYHYSRFYSLLALPNNEHSHCQHALCKKNHEPHSGRRMIFNCCAWLGDAICRASWDQTETYKVVGFNSVANLT